MANQNNGSWDVEAIVDRKYMENKPYYLLKWKNFDHTENTWEPASHLNCTELLEIFEAQRPAQLEEYRMNHTAEIGFGRGLEPEFVVGVTKVRDKLLYGVKWVDNTEADIIEAEIVLEKSPHLILEFYLESIGYRPSSHTGSSSQDLRGVEKKARFNGGSQGAEESIECTTPLHILQQKIDSGFTIEVVKAAIQDPITKDVVYKVHWHDVLQEECVPAEFAHRYFQKEIIKYFEKNIYYKEKYPCNMISDIGPALECLNTLN